MFCFDLLHQTIHHVNESTCLSPNACILHAVTDVSMQDAPHQLQQTCPRTAAPLFVERAGVGHRSLHARWAILAGWCPTSSGPAAWSGVPAPAEAGVKGGSGPAECVRNVCQNGTRDGCMKLSRRQDGGGDTRGRVEVGLLGWCSCHCFLVCLCYTGGRGETQARQRRNKQLGRTGNSSGDDTSMCDLRPSSSNS